MSHLVTSRVLLADKCFNKKGLLKKRFKDRMRKIARKIGVQIIIKEGA